MLHRHENGGVEERKREKEGEVVSWEPTVAVVSPLSLSFSRLSTHINHTASLITGGQLHSVD